MKINAIELEGFQSYREKERVELGGIALAAVIGPNHVGKSTIVSDALMYALYGKSRGSVINDIISRGQQKATVTLEFTVRGSDYKITRYRTRKGRSEAAVYVADDTYTGGWRDLSEKNPASADDILVDLIGMNAETAKLTWMISQGDFGAFCDMKPAPRREALADAFGLGAYAQLLTAADSRRRALITQRDKAIAEHERVRERIETLNVPGPYPQYDDKELDKAAKAAEKKAEKHAALLANADVDTADEALRDAQDNLEAFMAAHQRAQAQHAQAATRLDNAVRQAEATIREAERAIAGVEETQAALTRHRDTLTQVTERGRAARQQLTLLREQAAAVAAQPALLKQSLDSIQQQGTEIGEQIATLRHGLEQGQGSCWTCGQHLSPQDAQLLIDAKENQRSQLKAQWSEVNQAMKDAQREAAQQATQVENAEAAVEALQREYSTVQADIARAEQVVSTREQVALQLRKAQQDRTNAIEEREALGQAPTMDAQQKKRLTQAVDKAQEAASQAQASKDRREEFEAEMNAARTESRLLWQEKQRRSTVAEELATLRPKSSDLGKDVEALTQSVSDHELLVEAFKPSGIPSMILAGVVEELNDDANEVLGYLGDDNLGVRITTQRETARGSVDEKVMIYAVTADGEADYKTLSGSEKFRLALAVRIGLAQCIARRTNTPVETIVMDEGWGALDEETKLAVQDVLTRLSSNFNVYTVSHIDDVRSAFPTVIEVSADTGTSRCVVRQAA